MSQNNQKIDKKKIGIGIYYSAIIIVIIVLLYTLIFVKNDDPELLSIIRYMICFYSFGGILAAGIILREFFLENYIMKKMVIKIIVTVGVLVIGTIIFILVKKASIAMVIMFLSFASLMYALVPTIPQETKNKE